MNLIITGASGFIGGEVLSRALASLNPSSLSSAAPSQTAHTSQTPNSKSTIGAKSLNPEVTRKVSIAYTLAAANAFSTLLNSPKPLRFIYTSGFITIRDPNQSGWIYSEARKAGGEAETAILDFGEKTGGFESFVPRPAGVRSKERGIMNRVVEMTLPSVGVDELGAVMMELVEKGSERRVWENGYLRARGKEVLGVEKKRAKGKMH